MTITYFQKLFEYEHWANLTILEKYLLHPNPPQRTKELVSHIIAAQRIWIDRILGNDQMVAAFELFDDDSLLELFDMNYLELKKIIAKSNYEQLINYTKDEKKFIKSVGKILTHLNLHSAYHRGQLILLLKLPNEISPNTDFVQY